MTTKTKDNNTFSWFRELFFPIHGHEIKKFLPMALMMLCILFNYTVLRNVKDSLVINASGSGAEIVSFLKLWGTLPSAIIFMIFYAKITEIVKRENIFYICTASFLIFFGAFATLIYPNIAFLHPAPELVHSLKEQYPNIKWFIVMWGNWSFALFYILSELWGSVMLSLLFWQYANETVHKHQTKRFYPMFGLVGNIGLVLSGSAVMYFANLGKSVETSQDPWQVTLNYLMIIVVLSGLIITALYYLSNRLFEKEPEAIEKEAAKKKKKKVKLSVIDSFRCLLSSKHLFFISFIVFAYGISINFIDIMWKGQVKTYFAGDYNLFAAYMGSFSKTTGLIAIPIMLIGGNILRRLSWFKAASVTPLILATTGLGFFSVIIYGTYFSDPNTIAFGYAESSLTFLALAVHFGFWQNALTKATKYSLFDPTKEMAYQPLNDTLKTKGKAAVDVVGARLGKSGGAFTFFILQTILPSFALVDFSPILGLISLIILAIWFYSLKKLKDSIKEITAQNKTEADTVEEA